MTIELKNLDSAAVRAVAAGLASVTDGEKCRIVIPKGDYCPHRLVPILGLADYYADLGHSVQVEGLASVSKVRQLGDASVEPFGRVWRFEDYRDQYVVINALEGALMRVPSLGEGFRVGFIWCLNEVMDNVLNHSSGGADERAIGYVMVQYVADECRLKACVFDLGVGLRKSFANSEKYHPQTDATAIAMAVKANVTCGKGQGNGLWGLHELVRQSSGGRLLIKSGAGEYLYAPKENLESARESEPLPGFEGVTLVDFQFVSKDRLSINEVFPASCATTDVWLERNEVADGSVLLKVSDLAVGYGSRGSAHDLRMMVENVIDTEHRRVVLDFDGVSSCSSSFVDELLGKLVGKYGFFAYCQLVSVQHVGGLSERLINHSIAQRMASAAESATDVDRGRYD